MCVFLHSFHVLFHHQLDLKKLKISQLRRVARKVGIHVTSTDRKSDILQKLMIPLGHYSMIKNETKDDLRRLIENPTKEEMNRRERKGKVQYVATQVCIVGENVFKVIELPWF